MFIHFYNKNLFTHFQNFSSNIYVTYSFITGGIAVEFLNKPGVSSEPLAFQVINIRMFIAKDNIVTR